MTGNYGENGFHLLDNFDQSSLDPTTLQIIEQIKQNHLSKINLNITEIETISGFHK
jgi:hypothetical protein